MVDKDMSKIIAAELILIHKAVYKLQYNNVKYASTHWE